MTKKKYNPFKMWGSYVGTVIGFLIQYYFRFGLIIDKFCNPDIIACIPIIKDNSLIYFIILPIVGFLIGWGIHSLIRKIK